MSDREFNSYLLDLIGDKQLELDAILNLINRPTICKRILQSLDSLSQKCRFKIGDILSLRPVSVDYSLPFKKSPEAQWIIKTCQISDMSTTMYVPHPLI